MYDYCFIMKVKVKQTNVVLLMAKNKLRCYLFSINANGKCILLL